MRLIYFLETQNNTNPMSFWHERLLWGEILTWNLTVKAHGTAVGVWSLWSALPGYWSLSQHFTWAMIIGPSQLLFCDNCIADFPLQMLLGFVSITGEEPCECDRTVCYCSKWKKQNANMLSKSLLLYSNCSLLKLIWLTFGGVILCCLLPGVHTRVVFFYPTKTRLFFNIKVILCPRACCHCGW